MVPTSPSEYVLGHSAAELRRLIEQAAFFGDLTAEVFRNAGLGPGMSVLDVGCGVGDVAFLAAALVGPTGSVTGIDRAAEAVEVARARAAQAEAGNVTFEVADAATFHTAQTFDAVVGRLVLAYQPNPATVLRHLASMVCDGGIIAFHECDLTTASTKPELPLFKRMVGSVIETYRRANLEADMGSRLHSAFLEAGLPPPQMIAAARVESGEQSPAYAAVARVVESAAPMMERLGVANVAELHLETLEQRMREEVAHADAVVFMPRFVGAWVRVGS
ncbi:MAG: class I SAM-dependent methyltransferase [Acidobacteriota bacterium]|nr:class I SAM-dependent methyltransferase [Acidobacteriota bacterium]